MRLDTLPAAHFLSIQALFWNLDGTVTGGTVWLPGWISGEGRVEQETDGSWVTGRYAGAGLESSPRHTATGSSFQSLGQA